MTQGTGSHEPASEIAAAVAPLRAETATVVAEFDAAVDAVLAASPRDGLDDRPSGVAIPATSHSSTRPPSMRERSEA